LVEKYHPDIVYFDWWIGQPSIRPNLTRFAAFYYNSSLKFGDHIGVINYKDYAMQEHSAVLDLERGQLGDIRTSPWQTDTSISNKSWGYIQDDTFKSPENIVHLLVDIVSKNGNLLLNVGPRSDGTIPEQVQQVLLDLGAWLNVNGEAIYATRPWRIFGEGPTKVATGTFHELETPKYTSEDFRFTTKGNALYAIGLSRPANGEALIRSLAASVGNEPVQTVSLLGSGANVPFEQRPDGLHVKLPPEVPTDYAYVLRVWFARSSH
jgi:alpha-L-fucosidase